jgi:hypothetical protein
MAYLTLLVLGRRAALISALNVRQQVPLLRSIFLPKVLVGIQTAVTNIAWTILE